MEHSAYSEEPAEQAAGRHILKWLDGFIDRGDELQRLHDAAEAERLAADAQDATGGSPWMEADSGSTEIPDPSL